MYIIHMRASADSGGLRTEGRGEVGNRALDGFGGQDPSERGDVTRLHRGSCMRFASINRQLVPGVEPSCVKLHGGQISKVDCGPQEDPRIPGNEISCAVVGTRPGGCMEAKT